MNERLKELAEQAGASYYNTYTGPLLSPKDIEKFAELIVLECMNLVDDIDPKEAVRGLEEVPPYTVVATVLDNYLEMVRQHFGVEE